MKEYEFTLKFRLADASIDPESYIDLLAEAGCDDAIIGIGQKGSIALSFIREEESALVAVYSAIKNVRQAIPDARFIEATPDVVGLSDIAEVLGFTRQNMRKVMIKNSASFPSPIHEGKVSFWHLFTVLNWFIESKNYQIKDSLIDITAANMQLNISKEVTNIDPAMSSKFCEALSWDTSGI